MTHARPPTPEATVTLFIAARFCGPTDSGNGGYTCGRLAADLPLPAEVTLRKPPPLDRALPAQRHGEERVLLDADATVIAQARHVPLALQLPPAPDPHAAMEAATHYHGLETHAFPHCFVCGPARAPGDGLRLFAGRVADRELVACGWTPHADLAHDDGQVRSEFLWAALDCPGAWAWLDEMERPLVLGRLAVDIAQPPMADKAYIVGGWRLGREGRKHYSGTAIWRADGTPCAWGRATWIEVDPARFGSSG